MKPNDVNKYRHMKANETEQQFLKLAKTVPTDERVPGGFAARMMARVREQHSLETGSADERFLRFARNLPANERVPYAFEKRIMARLRELLTPDPLTHWSRMLWRAVAPCLGVMLLAVLFSAGEPTDTSPIQTAGELESTDFETVMLASFDDLELTW
ncbi:MAG: hypothetical protein QF749_08250 [Verrucomicrobiota bacterium]|nr:hypothetical protein [Verrucomicrobiota bacterium]MDP6252859.1 hypothetical protein [Verrucomicrobiota bacterium]MDP7178270.1 hypothetical protein [Verrucomicrobiota bacterium]MDP7292690.1 hypothetical protein [Verrucomicrobiota bacterium]MDP7442492.1 hypothetical protein [Verrucomicrobiota bacterium]